MTKIARTAALAATAALALAGAAPAAHAKKDKAAYDVGVAARSINPGADGKWEGQPVFLGGYGFGGGSPANPGRAATGILRDGMQVRAIAIGDGSDVFAVADAETQGWFAETSDGPYGIQDVRKAVEQATDGKLDASHVIVQSDHSHSGADIMGVWGGAPEGYRRYVVQQTISAILEAYRTRRKGTLWYGTAPGRDLLSNQFGDDPNNQAMDSDVRVLQARDDHSRPFATLLNFSAHATVLGASNTKATGDWVEAANRMLAQRGDGEPMTMVGTLGRTQPADRGCHDASVTDPDKRSICTLDDYAGRVVDRAQVAIANAHKIAGTPTVDAKSYLITDPATNAALVGLLYTKAVGQITGVPINRSITPPWMAGNMIGTVTASAKIGDVLLSAGPGEMYPQIPLKVRSQLPGLGGYMTAGLADDQLGYLIAPLEAYPEPIQHTFLPEPLDNDNYFFNVSHTMGERVTCSLLRGAGEVFGRGTQARDTYDRCSAFPNDAALPEGSDQALG